jgi:Uma2 family endonuclease
MKGASIMATVTEAPDRTSVVLEDVTWEEYEAQLRIIGDRHIRVNYDDGRMEIMSPLSRGGNRSYILGRMVDTLTEEFDIPHFPADAVTLKRPDLAKGVEPDKLYFLRANAAKVRRLLDLDLTVDPPPDLIIEVDETFSSVPRLPIFAALKILEVWRIKGGVLQFLYLQSDGSYVARDRSRAFPSLTLQEAARFLEEGLCSDPTPWIRSFRAFVRDILVPRRKPGDQ